MKEEIEKLKIKAKGNDKEALEAMLFLARIYIHGMYGEEKNLEKAKYWSNKAKELEEKLTKEVTSSHCIPEKETKKNIKIDEAFADRFNNIQHNLQFVGKKNIVEDKHIPKIIDINIVEKNQSKQSRKFDFDVDEINRRLKTIYVEKQITDEVDINKIKQRISKYSNSIPNHSLLDLGDKIIITSALELPAYKIVLDSHYEIRKLKEGSLPYRGEQIPRKLLDRANVDIWSFDLHKNNPINEFQERKEENYTIIASQEINRCNSCHGHGDVICDSCHGRGETICLTCEGRGKVLCSRCGGKGYVPNFEKYSSCSWCCGTGYEKCSFCNDGYQTCLFCDGRGKTTCPSCEGEGRVVDFLYIEDSFKTKQFIEKITNNSIYPQNMLKGEKFSIYDENGNLNKKEDNKHLTEEALKKKYPLEYKKYKEELESMEELFEELYGSTSHENLEKYGKELVHLKKIGFAGYYYETKNKIKNKKHIDYLIFNQKWDVILDFTNNIIPNNLLDSLNSDEHISLKQTFQKILSNSKAIPEFGILDKDYKILKQRINISKIKIVCVKYQYEQIEYDIWLYGDDYSFVYVEKSPITEIYDDYISESEKLLEQKQYSKALELVDKVYSIKSNDERLIRLKGEIMLKIQIQYCLGGLFGSFFLLPAAFRYTRTTINLSEWLYPTLGMIMCTIMFSIIIGLLVALIAYVIHSIKIKEDYLRYILPIVYSVFASIIINVLI